MKIVKMHVVLEYISLQQDKKQLIIICGLGDEKYEK